MIWIIKENNLRKTISSYIAITALFVGPINPLYAQNNDTPKSQCLNTDAVVSYDIVSDDAIRFTLKEDKEIIMWLKPHCPQLHFHGYVSYTPVNGRLCAGVDEVKTRSGLPCRISHLTKTLIVDDLAQ